MPARSWSTPRWCWSGCAATTARWTPSSANTSSRPARSPRARRTPPTNMASEADDDEGPFDVRTVTLAGGERVDKALAAALPELSRARLQALIAQGRVSRDGAAVADASARAQAGD